MSNKTIRLPNAPLVEAVFEMRWALQGTPGTPLYQDPGFLPMRDSFTKNVARLGFVEVRDMVSPEDLLVGHGIARRFYLAKDYPLSPCHLELRYLDAFDAGLVGTTDMVQFLAAGTSMKLDVPPSLKSKKIFGDKLQGRVLLQTSAKNWKATQFIFDLASGRRKEEAILRLETKVVTTIEGTPKLKKPQAFLSEVSKWLEFAHDITSPFFKDFVKPPVMQKFERAK
jgi:hypothetical protein